MGTANFLRATKVKEFAKEAIRQKGVCEFIVDLDECDEMDSTFMGTIAGIAVRLRELGYERAILLVNCSERNMELLRNLGLDQLLNREEEL